MIIKSLKIYSFGCLINKEFKFEKGLNLIYGENEKGKSTIEAFIKIMLYGFSSKKINGISNINKIFVGQKNNFASGYYLTINLTSRFKIMSISLFYKH